MTARRTRQRWLLALAYCLSAVLAQGLHWHGDHGPIGSELLGAASPCESSCGDPGEDAREPSAGFDRDAEGCPSCQFQLTHQAGLTPADGPTGIEPGGSAPAFADLITSSSAPRPHSRGPPRI